MPRVRLGAPVVEFHTGRYAHAEGEERAAELKRIADCAALAVKNGIEPHAGHGLTFDNVVPVAAIPQIAELNIGHFLIGEAIFTGLDASVRRMRELMDERGEASLSLRRGRRSARHGRVRRVRRHDLTLPQLGSLSRRERVDDRRHRLRPVQHRADRKSLERFGDKFLNRVFTEVEHAKAASRPHTRAGTLAKRFAAKEAFSKAVGTGFKRGVFMKDIGVVNLAVRRADATAHRRSQGAA